MENKIKELIMEELLKRKNWTSSAKILGEVLYKIDKTNLNVYDILLSMKGDIEYNGKKYRLRLRFYDLEKISMRNTEVKLYKVDEE